jgi:hypothetical protein
MQGIDVVFPGAPQQEDQNHEHERADMSFVVLPTTSSWLEQLQLAAQTLQWLTTMRMTSTNVETILLS